MYDLIGDIHGHADELVRLLEAMGYKKSRGVYGHGDRQAIFVGDFIDRGPQIRQVLEIVKPMIDRGTALSVMGNHELNALAYGAPDPEYPGEYLRRHTEKNHEQHQQTLSQLTSDELAAYLKWFRTLPLWLDLDGVRVVHACWDEQALSKVRRGLREHGGVTDGFLQSACIEGFDLFVPVEILLKGKEAKLPEGKFLYDKDGFKRYSVRTRWYSSPHGQTYGTYAFQSDPINSDLPLTESVINAAEPYSLSAKPVFFGHYWLSAVRPIVLAGNVACIDYSVAKGGFLCAYRWDVEQTVNDDQFVWVEAEVPGEP